MSVLLTVSVTRKALWPNVEYNSSPGVQVSRLILTWQESVCEYIFEENKNDIARNNAIILKPVFLDLDVIN